MTWLKIKFRKNGAAELLRNSNLKKRRASSSRRRRRAITLTQLSGQALLSKLLLEAWSINQLQKVSRADPIIVPGRNMLRLDHREAGDE